MERTPFETRHVWVAGKRTSIAIEPLYWRTIEDYAAAHESDWKSATEKILELQSPIYKSRSAFLRFATTSLAFRRIKDLQAELSNTTSFGGKAHSTTEAPEVTQNGTEYTVPVAPGSTPRDPTQIN